MKAPKNWPAPALVAGVFILTGWAATLAINWPGHLSYDSILQLQQGRSAVYNNWHPPVMAWLLGLGDALVPGAGLFVALDSVLAFGALAALLALRRAKAGWPAAIAALAIVLSPQLLLYQGIVWKDILFADAAVAGFAALAWAFARWDAMRIRTACLGLSFTLLTLAALTRQNGLVLLPCAGAALGWIAARHGLSRWSAAGLGAGFLAGTLALTACATMLLNLRSDGNPGPQEQIRLLQAYDLAGALAKEPALPLTALDPTLAHVLRTGSARLYTPMRNDPIASAPDFQAAVGDADPGEVGAQWRLTMASHPWLYLRLRSAAFYWVFATPDIVAARPVFTGVEGPAPPLKALGIAPRRDARDHLLERYGKAFFGTPVFSHVTFAVLAAASLVLLLRRRRPADIAVAAMLAGAFAFTASFFFISISCDYRYLYPLDLSALAALLYLVADIRSAIEGTP
jgi:hypothetical protein